MWRGTLGAAVALMLALPAMTQAADFFAAPADTGTGDCSSDANRCTLPEAIEATRNNGPALDNIFADSGTYSVRDMPGLAGTGLPGGRVNLAAGSVRLVGEGSGPAGTTID